MSAQTDLRKHIQHVFSSGPHRDLFLRFAAEIASLKAELVAAKVAASTPPPVPSVEKTPPPPISAATPVVETQVTSTVAVGKK